MTALLAQQGQLFAPGRPWGIVEIAIFIVLLLAIIGLVIIFVRVSGVPVPQWVWQVIGIVVAAVVVIAAIRFVAGM